MEAVLSHDEKLSFETIRAILQDLAVQQKETERQMKKKAKRFDRQMKENAERFDRQMRENAEQMKENAEQFDHRVKETDRQMKETDRRFDKQLGKLGNRFGEMVEYMVEPNLIKQFRRLGFVFDKSHQRTKVKDGEHGIFYETDISLENGDKVMVVEVKSKPSTEDITGHIERMKKIRAYADLHSDKRKFLGAVAGMIINESEKIFALKNGFYVIEPAGDTFTITVPEGDYSPREW
jgi:hypothetical protein